jgi:hypothetical protein
VIVMIVMVIAGWLMTSVLIAGWLFRRWTVTFT